MHCTSSTECELLLILEYQRLSLASSKNGPSYHLMSHHGVILKAISRDPVLCKSLTMLTCLRGSIEIAIIGRSTPASAVYKVTLHWERSFIKNGLEMDLAGCKVLPIN